MPMPQRRIAGTLTTAAAGVLALLLLGCEEPGVEGPGLKSPPAANDAQREMPAVAPGAVAQPGAPAPPLPPGAQVGAAATRNLPPTGNQVELSDAVIQRTATGAMQATLKYRFTAGRPDPVREYSIHVQFIGAPFYELKRFAGASLQEAGELQWEFRLPEATGKPRAPPSEFKLSLQEEETRNGRQGFAGRSNELSGKVTE